jgi:hypothetical protein
MGVARMSEATSGVFALSIPHIASLMRPALLNRPTGFLGSCRLCQRATGCEELAQRSQQPQRMVDKGTKGRARDGRLASGGHLAQRDVWVPYREGTLQHGDFLHGLPLIEARMMRIMFVLD